MPPKTLDHQSGSGKPRRKLISESPEPIPRVIRKKNVAQAFFKPKGARTTELSSKTTKGADIDDLASAFGNLLSKDTSSEKVINPEKKQVQHSWNHEKRAAILNARKIDIPPPERPMFFSKNVNANVWQKQKIARLYYDEREVQIEKANPPDPKGLINPADLIPKEDPEIQARRDAFAARGEAAEKVHIERVKVAQSLREAKSKENLARRNEASRKKGQN